MVLAGSGWLLPASTRATQHKLNSKNYPKTLPEQEPTPHNLQQEWGHGVLLQDASLVARFW